jgi:multidrug resistance efflux pump
MNKKLYIAGGVILLGLLYLFFKPGKKEEEITVFVKSDKFEVSITTNGELAAKSSVKIAGPSGGMRRLNLWNVKISDLIPEGTKVDSGDHVASLDKSDILGKLKDIELEIQKIESQYLQTKLDTMLNLRASRSGLVTLGYEFKDAEIRLEQSQFEPPATIKKIENEIDQKKLKVSEEKKNYDIKQRQSSAKMQEVEAGLNQKRNKRQLIIDVLDKFEILAPKSGIVIYKKDWDGSKVTTGSTISPWNSEVAELPDLEKMISKTYVNEVDIRKVKEGQLVELSIDAFPDKKLTGKVLKVANVGEQRPNSEAKVFQVTVEINEKDEDLLPGMSTGNKIIADFKQNTLFIPLEAVHAKDSVSYVFIRAGFSVDKLEVEVGLTNENHVEVLEGLEENDEVLLSIPENADQIELN